MEVSVCITVFNEEGSIAELLDSLLSQTKKPNEIVVVDGGSIDRTVEIIRHFQKRNKRIKLLVEKCSRSKGRNLGVEVARNNIIAMTDADCVAEKHWLERITAPFKYKEVDIVAGFYKMKGETAFQKAESIFLGITPSKFDVNFLPSTRSIAFRKEFWEKIGGFPEKDVNSAEDTDFNYKAVKAGAKIARVKNARVEWSIPRAYRGLIDKFYSYAKWDAKSGIWWHPVQRYASHNIKVVLIFVRYIIGFMMAIFAFRYPPLWSILVISLIFYIFWAFRKVFIEFRDWRAGLWGIIIQFISDFAVMWGFTAGIIKLR